MAITGSSASAYFRIQDTVCSQRSSTSGTTSPDKPGLFSSTFFLLRSDLFKSSIFFLPRICSRISKSSFERGSEVSATNNMISALSISFLAFSTPIFSTASSVSRIPAVSMIFKVIPSMVTDSSNVSLVVPAISVTIALSSPRRAFKKEDFPAFGLPTMQVRIPSAMYLPSS